ncbi:hypothetical protein PMAYCL1PPCAC_31499, partial [Pristionchus mayeri]
FRMNSISIVKKRFFNEDGTPADPNRSHQVQYALVPVNGSDEFEMEQDLLDNIANRRMLWLRRPSDIAQDEVTLRFFSSEPPPPLSVKHCETQVAPAVRAEETQTPISIVMTTGIQVEPDTEVIQTQTVSPDPISRVHCATQVQPEARVMNQTSLSDAFGWNEDYAHNDDVHWMGNGLPMIPKLELMEPKEESLETFNGLLDEVPFHIPKDEPMADELMEPFEKESDGCTLDHNGDVETSSLLALAHGPADNVEKKGSPIDNLVIKSTEDLEKKVNVLRRTKRRVLKTVKYEPIDEEDYRTPKTPRRVVKKMKKEWIDEKDYRAPKSAPKRKAKDLVDLKTNVVMKCNECSASIRVTKNGRARLTDHAMIHCAEKRFKCSLCVHTSVTKANWVYHFNHSHAGNAAELINLKNDLRQALWEKWTKKCFPDEKILPKRSRKVDTHQSQCGVCAKNVPSDDGSLLTHIITDHSEENLDYDDPQGVKDQFFPSSSSRR